MRLLKIAAFGAVVALSGCIDVDMNAEITGSDTARVSGYMQVQRGMLDMMGGAEGFCPEDEGGTIELTDTAARCNMLIEGSFEEVFDSAEEGPSPQVEDLGNGTVRVTFPIGAATADAAEMREDPNMVAMMRPMLEGHTFTLRISGAEVVSTNGERSADGRSAVFTFPLVNVLDPEAEFPETFEAVVRY
jgi:hypothetical protein